MAPLSKLGFSSLFSSSSSTDGRAKPAAPSSASAGNLSAEFSELAFTLEKLGTAVDIVRAITWGYDWRMNRGATANMGPLDILESHPLLAYELWYEATGEHFAEWEGVRYGGLTSVEISNKASRSIHFALLSLSYWTPEMDAQLVSWMQGGSGQGAEQGNSDAADALDAKKEPASVTAASSSSIREQRAIRTERGFFGKAVGSASSSWVDIYAYRIQVPDAEALDNFPLLEAAPGLITRAVEMAKRRWNLSDLAADLGTSSYSFADKLGETFGWRSSRSKWVALRLRIALLVKLNKSISKMMDYLDFTLDDAGGLGRAAGRRAGLHLGGGSSPGFGGGAGRSGGGGGGDGGGLRASSSSWCRNPANLAARLARLGHCIFAEIKEQRLQSVIDRTWAILPRDSWYDDDDAYQRDPNRVDVHINHELAFDSEQRGETSVRRSRCVFSQLYFELVRLRRIDDPNLFRRKLDKRGRLFVVHYRREAGVDWGGLYRDSMQQSVADLFSWPKVHLE